MALDDPVAVYSTRPTIEVGGMDYPALNSNIAAIRVSEALGGLTTAELSVVDWVARADGSSSFGADSGSPLVLGASLRVFLGPAEVLASEVFDGQIVAIEAEMRRDSPPAFTVIAEDRLFAARRIRKSRTFEAASLADLVSAIAADHGLTPEVRDGLDTPFSDWAQQDESDLAFLRRVLARFDADAQVVGNRLQAGRIGVDRRSAITLAAGTTLESVRITADMAHQISSTRLDSFDPISGDPVTGEAEATGSGPGRGRSGKDVLAADFQAIALPLGHHGPMTAEEATAMAQAEADRRARSFVTARGTAIGNAQLRVGSWITLAGVNPAFANDYAVKQAVHRYEPVEGYRTDFVAECAYLGAAA